jgi:glutamate synthase-like protein
MLDVDPERGLETGAPIRGRLVGSRPYGRWLDDWRREASPGERAPAPDEDLASRHVLFGYTREELSLIVRPSASHGHEPTSSMGDDTATAAARRPREAALQLLPAALCAGTNPAIDHIRERFVMSLVTLLGGRAPLLVETPEAAAGIELESFFLFPSPLDELAVVRLDATFDSGEGLAAAQLRQRPAARRGVPDGALLPHGHVPRGDHDAAPGATGQLRRDPMMIEDRVAEFRLVVPRAEHGRIEAASEGTERGADPVAIP